MTDLYYAFIAGFAGGVVIAVGALALIALRTLGEEDLPEEEPRQQWLQEFIDERRRLSFNPELHAHETANINLFLDELEKARRAARA